MPLGLRCPACTKGMRVPEHAHGRRVQCPRCDHIYRYTGQPELTLGWVPEKRREPIVAGVVAASEEKAAPSALPAMAMAVPVVAAAGAVGGVVVARAMPVQSPPATPPEEPIDLEPADEETFDPFASESQAEEIVPEAVEDDIAEIHPLDESVEEAPLMEEAELEAGTTDDPDLDHLFEEKAESASVEEIQPEEPALAAPVEESFEELSVHSESEEPASIEELSPESATEADEFHKMFEAEVITAAPETPAAEIEEADPLAESAEPIEENPSASPMIAQAMPVEAQRIRKAPETPKPQAIPPVASDEDEIDLDQLFGESADLEAKPAGEEISPVIPEISAEEVAEPTAADDLPDWLSPVSQEPIAEDVAEAEILETPSDEPEMMDESALLLEDEEEAPPAKKSKDKSGKGKWFGIL